MLVTPLERRSWDTLRTLIDHYPQTKALVAMLYRNRSQAGKVLAETLHDYANRGDVIVLALPRGGVPVAFEIARSLIAPLDVFIVRKLGVPGHEELAMGAIASGGIQVLNESVLSSLKIQPYVIDQVAAREQIELERREHSYRSDREPLNLEAMIVILVDDGLATGASMKAAVRAVKTRNPKKVIVAVPVAEKEIYLELGREVEEIVCAATPYPFQGVGQWYGDFTQVTDEEVRTLLALAKIPPSHIVPKESSVNL